MDTHVYLAIIFAAVLHAGWNAALKANSDRATNVLILSVVQGSIALPLLAFLPQPSVNSLPLILAASFLHCGYKIFLMKAYDYADLNQVYPLARGLAPVIVTIVSILFFSAQFGVSTIASIAMISIGIIVLGITKAHNKKMSPLAWFFTCGTAAFIASYTVVDGIGVRLSEAPSAYVIYLFLGDAIATTVYFGVTRSADFLVHAVSSWRSGFFSGILSLGAYWIAVWAFTKAPIAVVASLRETSILFAVLIGTIFLKEPMTNLRWASIGLIAIGAIAIKI